MAEPRPDETKQERESWVPASFEKRAAAWTGVVYVLMLLFILNFTLFTGGRQLPGTFPCSWSPFRWPWRWWSSTA